MRFIPPLKKIRRKLIKFFSYKWQSVVVGLTFFFVTSYFTVQKLFGLSLSGLITEFFNPNAAAAISAGIKWSAGSVLFYTILARVAIFFIDAYPLVEAKSPEPKSLNQCVLRVNAEIEQHMASLDAADCLVGHETFINEHRFRANIALILVNFSEHLVRSFPGVQKVKDKDIFISVYEVPSFHQKDWKVDYLDYVHHVGNKRDTAFSQRITLAAKPYSTYECAKAITNKEHVKFKWDCSDYTKGISKQKTVKHYVGFRLSYNGKTIGFINVEFHNHEFFADEEKMREFVEKDMIAFKFLIEYQFLKKKFFTTVWGKWTNLKFLYEQQNPKPISADAPRSAVS